MNILMNILMNFDFSVDFSLTNYLLTIASFRIGVPSILFWYKFSFICLVTSSLMTPTPSRNSTIGRMCRLLHTSCHMCCIYSDFVLWICVYVVVVVHCHLVVLPLLRGLCLDTNTAIRPCMSGSCDWLGGGSSSLIGVHVLRDHP